MQIQSYQNAHDFIIYKQRSARLLTVLTTHGDKRTDRFLLIILSKQNRCYSIADNEIIDEAMTKHDNGLDP